MGCTQSRHNFKFLFRFKTIVEHNTYRLFIIRILIMESILCQLNVKVPVLQILVYIVLCAQCCQCLSLDCPFSNVYSFDKVKSRMSTTIDFTKHRMIA